MGTISGQLVRMQALLSATKASFTQAIPHRVAGLITGTALVLLLGAGTPAVQSVAHTISVARSSTAPSAQIARFRPFADCPGSASPC